MGETETHCEVDRRTLNQVPIVEAFAQDRPPRRALIRGNNPSRPPPRRESDAMVRTYTNLPVRTNAWALKVQNIYIPFSSLSESPGRRSGFYRTRIPAYLSCSSWTQRL